MHPGLAVDGIHEAGELGPEATRGASERGVRVLKVVDAAHHHHHVDVATARLCSADLAADRRQQIVETRYVRSTLADGSPLHVDAQSAREKGGTRARQRRALVAIRSAADTRHERVADEEDVFAWAAACRLTRRGGECEATRRRRMQVV